MSRARSVLPLLASAAALGAVLAGPAAAAPPVPPVSAEPVQVAGPPEAPAPAPDPSDLEPAIDDGYAERTYERLYAGRRGRAVCVGFDPAAVDPPEDMDAPGDIASRDQDRSCGWLRRDDADVPFALMIVAPRFEGAGDGVPVGGAVRPEVAAVELVGPGRRTVRIPTTPAPAVLAGTAAGELRYFLGTVPGGEVRTSRLLDAQGAVLRESDQEGGMLPGRLERGEGRLVRGPVTLGSGGRGAGRWRLIAELRAVLAPLPGAPARRERALCYELRVGRDPGESGHCTPLPAEHELVVPQQSCEDGTPNVVVGVTPAAKAPRAIVTTDGRRVPVRRFAPPASFGAGDARVALAVAPAGSGIRAGGGHGYSGWALPPTDVSSCVYGAVHFAFSEDVTGQPALGGDSVVRPGGVVGPRVFVRDREEELCVAVERPVRRGDCREPAAALEDVRAKPGAGGRMAAGVVDGRVRQVRLTLSTGAHVVVPAAPDPAYTGRYAPHVAFFAYVAPEGTRVERVAPIGPRGTVFSAEHLHDPALAAPARALGTVRIRGVRRVVAEAPWERRGPCTFLARGPLPGAGDACPEAAFVDWLRLDVPCGKAPVVGGMLTGSAGRLEAVLDDGRRVGTRVVRVNRARGVAYLTLPRGAGVRRVLERSPGGRVLRRYRLAVPPPAEHCGYHLSPSDDRTSG